MMKKCHAVAIDDCDEAEFGEKLYYVLLNEFQV